MLDSARAFHKQNALAVHVLSGRLPPLLSCSAPPGTPSGAKRTFTMHGSTELGILFALGTAFSWATAGIIHTAIARRVGVQGVMLLRQPRSRLPVFRRAASDLSPFSLAGRRFRSYRHSGWRRMPLCRSPAHRTAPRPGLPFPFRRVHRNHRRNVPGGTHRSARCAPSGETRIIPLRTGASARGASPSVCSPP